MLSRQLYVHFLDAYHVERAYRNSHSPDQLASEGRRALRIAMAVSDTVFVPASTYFESALARQLLAQHPFALECGKVLLTAGDPDLETHRISKDHQYDLGSPAAQRRAYRASVVSIAGYRPRPGDTRTHITESWLAAGALDQALVSSGGYTGPIVPESLTEVWAGIPDALGNRAFVPGHVLEALRRFGSGPGSVPAKVVSDVIERAYVETYTLGLNAGVVRGLVRLVTPFSLPTHPDSISYPDALDKVRRAGLLSALDDPNEDEFLSKQIEVQRSILGQNRSAARQNARPTVGIVTILEEEFAAVVSQLENPKSIKLRNDPHAYMLGEVRKHGDSKVVEVLVSKQLHMTPKSAATSATLLLKAFPSIRDVIVAGIGGAIPRPGDVEKDVSLGDVVVSTRAGVVDIDHVTRTVAGSVPRSLLPPPSPNLLGALDRHRQADPRGTLTRRRLVGLASSDHRFVRPPPSTDVLRAVTGEVVRTGGAAAMSRTFPGVVASGGSLLRDPVERDRIGSATGALVIEMEGAGVAEAAWTLGRGYFLVRGLTDYCDDHKNDAWHWYAAAAAACVAVEIVAYL